MIMVLIFLTALFIAPQLWIAPFVGLRTDLIIYPLWLMITVSRQTFLKNGLTTVDKVFLFFLFWLVVTTAVNGLHAGMGGLGHKSSIGIIVDYVKWFFLFQFIVATADSVDKVRKITKWIVFFAMILVVESIMHKHSPEGIGWAGQALGWVDRSVLEAGGTGRTRWIAIFDGPGVFCVVFTTALPFVLAMFDRGKTFGTKFLGLLLLPPLMTALYYTGSRGGFLATIGIFGLYFAYRYKISITKIGIGAGLVVLVFMMAPSHLTNMDDESNSASHRVEMWIEGVEMVTQNPAFGIGRGRYAQYTGSLIAHNSAIEIMGELGVPGFVAWLGLIYLALKHLWVFYRSTEDPVQRSLASSLGICLLGYLASSMFVTLEYETYYFILALCIALGRTTEEKISMSGKEWILMFSGVVLWILILKVFFRIYF